VLAKRYDPTSLAQALALRQRLGTRLVLDLCDNHFFARSPAPEWQARAHALRQAVEAMDLVVASTPELARVVRAQCPAAPEIVVIGDPAEPLHTPAGWLRWRHAGAEARLVRLNWQLRAQDAPVPRARLVWFGQQGTAYADAGMADLACLRAPLEALNAQQAVSLTVISNSRARFDELMAGWALPTHYLAWHPATFSRALQAHEVALIPVSLNPFTVCKTSNRLVTALSHGLGVAAQSIPSYRDWADCTVQDDWGPGLLRLVQDTAWRHHLVQQGAARVAGELRPEQLAAQWQAALRRLQAG